MTSLFNLSPYHRPTDPDGTNGGYVNRNLKDGVEEAKISKFGEAGTTAALYGLG